MSKKAHICFVAPNAFSMISSNSDIKIVGGAELQQSLLAKALAQDGYQVSMICMDHGQDDYLVIDGVRIIKAYKPDAGLPGLRFLHPRLSSVWRCMMRANADIYIQRAAGMLTGVVVAFCRLKSKKSIFSAASDADFRTKPTHIKYRRDLWLYRYGVGHVDKILVQNPSQQQECKRLYGRESVLVPNIYSVPESATNNPDGYILWISTIRQLKRPEIFVKLAKFFPEYQFKMIGGVGSGDEYLFNDIKAQAVGVSNLEFVGFVPYSQVDHYFDSAKLVINTSDYEGFPNAFLQAWAREIPTISFFDCGARIDGQTVGLIVSSFDGMVEQVKRLMNNPDKWRSNGIRCKKYFEANNSIKHVKSVYRDIFLNF